MPTPVDRVRKAATQICSNASKECIVCQQVVECRQLRVHPERQLGHPLEQVHGIVAVNYHGAEPRRQRGVKYLQPDDKGSFCTAN